MSYHIYLRFVLMLSFNLPVGLLRGFIFFKFIRVKSYVHFSFCRSWYMDRQSHPLDLITQITFGIAERYQLAKLTSSPKQSLFFCFFSFCVAKIPWRVTHTRPLCWRLKLTGLRCSCWSYRNSQNAVDVNNKENNIFLEISVDRIVEIWEHKKTYDII